MTTHPMLDVDAWQAANRDSSLVIADGYRVTVAIRGGCLVINDGPMTRDGSTRERRYARVPRIVKHVAILSTNGYVTLEAERWMADCEITWCVIDRSGRMPRILSTSAAYVNPLYMRRQAMCAPGMPAEATGLAINRYLIQLKLEGQADTSERVLHDPETAQAIRGLAERVSVARSLDSITGLEGNAADHYWAAWKGLPLVWLAPKPIRAHWARFPSRKTLRHSWETNRYATDPVNAMLNFGYWAAYTECALACYGAHLSPAMGISHRDRVGRDSFALDLIELMRPRVDRIILGIMAERLNPRHYGEGKEGIVRVNSPLTHKIVAEVHAESYAITQAMFTVTGLLDKVSRNRKITRGVDAANV